MTLFHHTLEQLQSDQTTTALFKALIQDVGEPGEHWLGDEPSEVMSTLGEADRAALEGVFSDLSWYEGARFEALYTLVDGESSGLGTPYDVVWLDVRLEHERQPNVPASRLSDARELVTKLIIGEQMQRMGGTRDTLVLWVTVSGPTYARPDVYVAGPASSEGGGGERISGVHVRRMPLHRLGGSQLVAEAAQYLDTINALHGASKAHWRSAFTHSYATLTAIRDRFREELRASLRELMRLLELASGVEATTPSQLRSLREAATLIMFRLMFLLEVERRDLLYKERPKGKMALVELMEDHKTKAAQAGALIERVKALTLAIRGEQAADDELNIAGASIFGDRPNEGFAPDELTPWLAPLDALEISGLDAELARRWDDALYKAGAVSTGQLTKEFHLSSQRLGAGAEAHTHRILGDVYEQILAMVPARRNGQIELNMHASDDDERSALGAHYTPPELVEEIVRPALGHLFAQRWADVKRDVIAYKEALLKLHVCDPAMGSAHFLTVAALEIARELAWVELNGQPRDKTWHEPMFHVNPIGPNPEGFDPATRQDSSDFALLVEPVYGGQGSADDFEARVRAYIPKVVQQCIFGVDINPLACELGKLSLWLFTLTAGDKDHRPELTFLDGNIKSGNSLLGVTLSQAEDILVSRLGVKLPEKTLELLDLYGFNRVLSLVDEYQDKMRLPIEQLREVAGGYPKVLGGQDPMLAYSTVLRQRFYQESVRLLEQTRWFYDLATLVEFYDYKVKAKSGQDALYDALCAHADPSLRATLTDKALWQRLISAPISTADATLLTLRDSIERAAAQLPSTSGTQRAFHWEVAFPSMFSTLQGKTRGFDAIVANPPFVGDRKARAFLGDATLEFIKNRYLDGAVGDLCAFFVRLFDQLVHPRGVASTLGPNTLAQASNRRYALVPLLTGDSPRFSILRARQSEVWPGEAKVHICMILMARVLPAKPTYLRFQQRAMLATAQALPISSYLDVGPETDFMNLPSMSDGICYTGHFLRGEYFLHVEPDETLADAIARVPEAERSSLFAYLNNQELVQQPRPEPSRIAIDFFDDLEEAGLESASSAEQLAWLRENRPVLLEQLETPPPGSAEGAISVRQYRETRPSSRDNDAHIEYWWMFGRPRVELRARWKGLQQVVAFGRVSKVWSPSYLATCDQLTRLKISPSDRLSISPIQSKSFFGIFTCFMFENHIRRESTTLKADFQINVGESIPVFPMPWSSKWSDDEGRPWIGEVPKSIEESLGVIVDELLVHRQMILDEPLEHGVPKINSQWGPTDLYNLYDDAEQTFEAIERLRELHRELLAEVMRAYGWDDLVEGVSWGFEYPWIDRTQRYVPDAVTRAALFERLGALNQARYKEELALYLPHVVEAMILDGKKSYSVSTLNKELKERGVQINDGDLEEVLKMAAHGNRKTHKVTLDSKSKWRRVA